MSANNKKYKNGRYLIVNADDFGASSGINRGIVDCHQRGVVTSTSLMVTGRALDEAIALSIENPRLSIGLHFDVWGEDERDFDTHDIQATRDEFHIQLDRFVNVMGRMPTHIDSHRHCHRAEHLFDNFRQWVEPLDLPLRGAGEVRFIGSFYAQWEWKVTNLDYVSTSFLERLLKEEVQVGVTEFSCHPGYVSDDYNAVYFAEREVELGTLTTPKIRKVIDELGISLINYSDYNARKI